MHGFFCRGKLYAQLLRPGGTTPNFDGGIFSWKSEKGLMFVRILLGLLGCCWWGRCFCARQRRYWRGIVVQKFKETDIDFALFGVVALLNILSLLLLMILLLVFLLVMDWRFLILLLLLFVVVVGLTLAFFIEGFFLFLFWWLLLLLILGFVLFLLFLKSLLFRRLLVYFFYFFGLFLGWSRRIFLLFLIHYVIIFKEGGIDYKEKIREM